VAVRCAGVSYVDVLTARGRYQLELPLPFVPGSEFSGLVEAVGDGVDPALLGAPVMATMLGGALSEAVIVPASRASVIPPSMDFATAAIFRASYVTAYHALVHRGRVAAGETVLVLGAGGAVGYAAVELARAFGAKVIASASSPEKRALAMQGGATAAVDSRSKTWREDVRAANEGRPVDIVVDPLGGEATEPAFRSLAWNGRHLVIGFAAGHIPKVATNLALLKGASLVGVDARQFGEYEPERAAQVFPALLALYDAGHLHPPIARRYPFERFAEAMQAAESGSLAGRIIVDIGG
jgi:NADPH2:quinone reductase